MADLPAGTVTFLFTDIEGSARLWEEHPVVMRQAMARHDALVEACVERHGGVLVQPRSEGDSAFIVFARATDAAAAAAALQRALLAEPWPTPTPVRARMALHTGESEVRDGQYYGVTVNRCAQLRRIAHGGQTLLSLTTAELVRDDLPEDVSLRPLGSHRLKDLQRPEQVFQLMHPDLPVDFPPLRSLDAFPNNLPIQLSIFIGRAREIVEIKRLLSGARLVTLTGSGGCGKTRLGMQVAADLPEEYPDGVWLAGLASLSVPTLVPQAVASALGVREEPGRPLVETLVDVLRPKSLLLVLDNCEHLLSACAHLAETVLRQCRGVRILSTSREALGITGESTYRVPSLAVPDLQRLPTVEHLKDYEAIRLFVERALFNDPGFAVRQENAPAVVQICHRLDGIPLALELAAARVKVLSVEQISGRLDDRFRLLTGGSRTALRRHQTLRAAIDWSYELLSAAERILLRRLSVFAGGFTLEAAEAVCAWEGVRELEVLDLLTQLVGKSLVLTEEQEEEIRYRLLETIRQYGHERLQVSGEGPQLRLRHGQYFLIFAERAEPELTGASQPAWLDRLEREHDNLRAALRGALQTGNVDVGLRLGGALWRFWYVRGHLSEGRGWLERVLAGSPGAGSTETPGSSRAKALNGAGNLAWSQGDYPSARSFHAEGLAIKRALGDNRGIASSLNNLGIVAHALGEHAAARAFYEEGLAIMRELGDRQGIAALLDNLGIAARDQGDTASARTILEESLALRRALNDQWGIANSLDSLALVARDKGDHPLARKLLVESLEIRRGLSDRSGIASSLEAFARLAAAQAQHGRAASLFGAAEALREAIGASLFSSDRIDHDRHVAAARAGLSEEAFAAMWAQGRTMPSGQAIADALEAPIQA